MAGLITCSTVLLLARKRLERVETLLRGKVLSGGAVNEIDRQVLFLARQALRSLNRDPIPANRFDADTFAPWLATGISQYAVMGSVGPEITRFAARFAPGQDWLVQTLRSGNPDPQRPQVLARSTDFLLKLCERIVAAAAQIDNADDRSTRLEQMRAFALGWACHIATEVASAPYRDAVAAELGDTAAAPPRQRLSVQAVRGALEEAVARQVYRRTNPRGGDWNGWLPADDQVPQALFEALAAAAADVYGQGARVSGSKAFDTQLAAHDPPALSRRLIEDGYGEYRLLTERGYSWRYVDWLKATLVMFLPASLMYPFAAFLPQGRHQRRDADFFTGKPPDQQRDDERAVFEVLTFPLAANAAVPFGLTLWLMLGSRLGVGKETIFGIVSASVSLAAAVAFFATLGLDDNPAWVRWLFMFAIPLGLEVALIAYVLGRGGRDARHLQLALGALTHVGLALLFVILFVAVLHFGIEGVVDDGAGSGAFWGSAAGWFVLVGVLWLVTAALLNRIDSSLPGVTRDDFAGGRRHYLRLFDDTTLGAGPLPGTQATPAQLHQRLFPPGRVPLLKLWWEDGAHPLFVRSDRHSLVFAFSADGSSKPQRVSAPLAPMTATDYGQLLKKAVQDFDGNFSGKLRVERVVADEPLDPTLPTGAVFADHGDDQATVQAYLPAAQSFRAVPGPDQEPYVLHLAPHEATTLRMGQAGSVLASTGLAPLAGPGALNAVVAPGSANLVGDANTRFLDTFVPGDVIETVGLAPNDQARVVVAVQDDQHLSVSLAFNPFPAATGYRRLARDRETDLAGTGTVATDTTVFRQLVGTGTQFERLFMAGDRIEATPPFGGAPESRTVAAVLSPTLLLLDLPFSANVPGTPIVAPVVGAAFARPGRLRAEGFNFAPTDPTPPSGLTDTLGRAADLATLLCLGTASHALLANERAAVAAGPADQQHAAVNKAYQVMRNWNLDHRRGNEWRMLVAGQAVSEKHGLADRADGLQPLMPAAWRTPAAAGEGTANDLGWVPLLQAWLEMAGDPRSDTVADRTSRPDRPSNLHLSRGLAFLLDLPTPV
ncbi:hypothetical protein [Sphaerotilus microaerophilus]|uniref:Uncharacterized protein n=1 Tax=Sphaerotilus microaerophilus TaxID=2914710 RepID=A0ABM7YJY7_9BURK|nr:hypothetical protein [Sphaerotilus sp. FB-5]BDI04730.1 hypothetical protein CATMQ487_17000 [Sphaerotilus sp. FB-5]